MASNSGRRSGSSGDSTRHSGEGRRESVYIGGRNADRSLEELRASTAKDAAQERGRTANGSARARKSGPRPGVGEQRPRTRAEREAHERRSARDAKLVTQRRKVQVRAAAVVLVVLGVVAGCGALYRSPLFKVTRVEVVGAAHVGAGRIRTLAAVPSDATLIRFPADAVAGRVGKDPWVASVTVSRLFPDGMRIRVIERQPVAMVDVGQTLMLVDSTGMVLGKRSVEQTSTAIVIRDVPGLDLKAGRRTTSEPLLNAIAVVGSLSDALRARIGSVSAPTIDATTLYTRDRIEIVFGEVAGASTKDALIQRILDEHRGKVVSIDVRTIDRPTWRGLTK
ncbi:MAG: FtsQ-type POTRA domain-containing protein [Coriobacteriia bacterium]|nr:FtsQ-type POTRA domain-containing protein [Coriobacteriia bacterium]